jgi:hypothetical protein
MGTKELDPFNTASAPICDLGAHRAPDGRPAFTRRVREEFPRGLAAAGFCGVVTPSSLHYVATTRGSFMPDIDPAQHTADDSRPGGSALTFTMDDLKRLPVRHPLAFHRVRGKPAQWPAKDRAGIARDDQLRRMDRRAAFNAAQGMRPERQRDMVRR